MPRLGTEVCNGACNANLVCRPATPAFPAVVVLLGLLLGGCGINVIPTLEEQAKAKWSDVQNQYQRRADLIPNLVETVKGFAAQERQVLEAVVKARAQATGIQLPPDLLTNPEAFKRFQDAQAQLSGALGRLIAVSERYPELKSNQNFLALQAQLEGTENRIAVARRDYIEVRARIQYGDPDVARPDLGEPLVWRQADADVHGRGGVEQAPAGQVLM